MQERLGWAEEDPAPSLVCGSHLPPPACHGDPFLPTVVMVYYSLLPAVSK